MKRFWLLLISLTAGPAFSAGHDDARQILEQIETPRDVEVPFTEQRMSVLLAEPLLLEGTVMLASNGLLIKKISRPLEETALISKEGLTLQRNGKVRRIALNRARSASKYFAALRALLDGDIDGLLAHFEIGNSSLGEHWSITLIPSDDGFRGMLQEVTISGDAGRLMTVRTVQSSDNWQEMSLALPAQP